MKRILTTVFILFLMVYPVFSDSGMLQEAAEKYKQGAYASSREIWQALIDQGYNNAELYLNVGNSFFMEKKYPEAILYFQKSLVRDPGMSAARDHLKKAQEVAEVEPVDTAGNVLADGMDSLALFLPGMAWLALFSLVLCIWIWMGFRNGWMRSGWILMPAFVFLFLAIREDGLRDRSGEAVVRQDEVLRTSPDAGSPALAELRAGETIKTIDQIGNWIKVEGSGTSIGWIPLEQVWKID
jgi:tetratricopeptide (TPR) repeat protein